VHAHARVHAYAIDTSLGARAIDIKLEARSTSSEI
jgi:hypothetical protein